MGSTRSKSQRSLWGLSIVVMLALAAAITSFAQAERASAHQDPPDCTSNGVGISFTVYRDAAGTMPISGGDPVEPGEEIFYETTLSLLPPPNCSFGGGPDGQVTITTPDGVEHFVVEPGDVPHVDTDNPTFTAPLQSYVVSAGDAVGTTLTASTAYDGGISHTGGDEPFAQEGHDVATATATRNITMQQVPLNVVKDATPEFDRTFEWTIDKSVDPAEHTLEPGESADSVYTITLTKSDPIDSNFGVSGIITIENPALATATIESVVDEVDGIVATVDCGAEFPIEVAPEGGTLECTYEADLPDDTTLTNTATVTTSGEVLPGEATATVDFTGVEPTTVTLNEVNVADTNDAGDAGPFDASTSYDYTLPFTCPEDEGDHENTATIVETGASDDALVTVVCPVDLVVTKDADPEFDRAFEWTIDKSVDPAEHTLNDGESGDSVYTITLTKSDPIDSNFRVSGTISITNPSATATATIDSVVDAVDGTDATVECGVMFPHDLGPGATLDCTYEADLADDSTLINTVTVETTGAVGGGTATATVDFTGVEPTTVTLNEVSVDDTNDAGDAGPFDASTSYDYTLPFTCPEDEGDHQNTATIVETGQSDDALVTVICEGDFEGLTPGFWKNHTDVWEGYSPDMLVGDVFDVPAELSELADDTLLEALNYRGGRGEIGMARILLRSAVAALLNAAHPEVNYPMTEAEIIDAVNAALASMDRDTMEMLKDELDANNNLGGGIDAHGNPI